MKRMSMLCSSAMTTRITVLSAPTFGEGPMVRKPFTKCGTIPVSLVHVSRDVINDEKRGPIYSARARLQRATVQVEDKTANLSAGMAVTVEIKTGKRRVIEYFLSPLLQYGSESLRER